MRYIVAVQCHIVKERCSGYLCERAFTERSGGFAVYTGHEEVRFLPLTCGGCCGRATHRKLSNLMRQLKAKEGVDKGQITVHLASCICNDNYHAPPCPHQGYLEQLIRDKLGLALAYGSRISTTAEARRRDGVYISCAGGEGDDSELLP